jgi:acyl dehydratase
MPRYIERFNRLITQTDQELGVTPSFVIDQVQADMFGLLVRDFQPAYNNPDWYVNAGDAPETEVHPLHLVSLTARILLAVGLPIRTDDEVAALNYGYGQVSWPAPLRIGQPARARVRLDGIEDRGAGRYLVRATVTMEAEGTPNPVMVAETLSYYYPVQAPA